MRKVYFIGLMFIGFSSCNGHSKSFSAQTKREKASGSQAFTWSKEDQALFTAGCIGTAKGLVGEVKAESYCACMLKEFEQRFSSMDSAMISPLDTNELNRLVEKCRE